jgi:conjugative transfer region protein (TIGR03748 family)
MSFKALFSLVLLAVVAATAHPVLAQTVTPDGSQVQVGRYTTQAGAPTESLSDPLSVYAQLSYPRQTVNTVGEALAHTLVRTGFRLVPAEALEEAARNFLALPLPESQRRMGPHRVSDLLKTLLGPAWQLHSDPVSRQVWFTRSASKGTPAPQPPRPQAQAMEAERHADAFGSP